MAVVLANAVSYLGELFETSRRPNALLNLLGGFRSGVVRTTSREFPVGTFYALDAPAQPAILEGAVAPAATTRAITQATNVVQIFDSVVGATWLAQGERSVDGVVPIPQGGAQGPVQNPRSVEAQLLMEIEQVACHLNYTLLRGAYANPADPSAVALKTRGLLTSVTTNSTDNSALAVPDAETYKGWVEALVRSIVDDNGYSVDDKWTLFVDATQYNNCAAAFETKAVAPTSRTVAGYQLRQLLCRMGTLNLVLEPDMPANTILCANLGQCAIVGMEVPGKGIFFESPITGSTASADQTRLYGQFGMDHGPEWMHGKLVVPVVVLT